MQQIANVDRYLTQRVGIIRRLLDADVPPATAERWVAAWEDEAQRRGLEPEDGAWWRSAWAWIANGCGSAEGEQAPADDFRTGPLMGGGWALPVPVVGAIQRTNEALTAFRDWLDARVPGDASAPDAPDHEWLRHEMERLCSAYEVAIGQGKRSRRRPSRTRATTT